MLGQEIPSNCYIITTQNKRFVVLYKHEVEEVKKRHPETRVEKVIFRPPEDKY